MESIVLTEFGEILIIRKPYIHDGIVGVYAELGIGVHEYCSGIIGSRPTSATYTAIFCKVCNLRIVVPIEVDTYEKLRQWCADEIEKQKQIDQILAQLYVERMQLLRISAGQK